MSRTTFLVRSLFVIGFVIGVPLLALPRVANRLGDLLYGAGDDKPTSDDRKQAGADDLPEADAEQMTWHAPLADSSSEEGGGSEGLDGPGSQPPPMATKPNFPPAAVNEPLPGLARQPDAALPDAEIPAAGLPAASPVDPQVLEVRQRLEDLGADYIRLEVLDDGRHRFSCRMLVRPGETPTRSFESTGTDAGGAADEVLREVEAWRKAQVTPLR